MPHKKGKIYNNGTISKKFCDGDPIPDGWVLGRLPSKSVSEERKQEIVAKRKRTFIEKYGVDNPAKAESVKAKIKKTNLERYGVTCTVHSDKVQSKIRESNLEKYGVEHTFQAKEVKDKIKKTNLKRYGVENPFASSEVQQKIQNTNLGRYGVAYPMQSEQIRDKSKNTSLELYGVEYPNQSEIVKRHIVESCLEKYGVEHPAQNEDIKAKALETNMLKYGYKSANMLESVKEQTKNTNLERYGVEWTCQMEECRSAGSNNSTPNKLFAKLLDKEGILYEREFRLGSYSYDFKIGNTLVEINPYATHNTLWSPFGNHECKITKNYHLKKTIKAEENGYRVIHVYDWDDTDKILRLVKDRDVLYARNCVVADVSLKDSIDYLKEYHIQNSCKGQEVRLGLYSNGSLVSLMTFGKPRYNKNYEYELLRYCSSVNVIGGAEKLFRAFINKYCPKSVISYCDRGKFEGKVYTKLGFSIKSLGNPTCHWYNFKTKEHYTDALVRQRGVDQLLGTSYGKGTSNKELLLENGFLPIYDCGQATYVWGKKDEK